MKNNSTQMRITLTSLALGACAASFANTYHDQYLAARLAETRVLHAVPALTAAVWSRSGIAAKGVVGRRKNGASTLALITDRFHIGSITKPVTSTLVAEMIERGMVPTGYSASLIYTHPWVFQSPNMGWTQYRTAPLLSYLSHVDGMRYQPLNEPQDEYASYGVTNLRGRRNGYVRDAVRDQPYGPVGAKRVYAGGHIVVASMLETVTNTTWESLVDQYVFTPLGMTSAGFGPMSSRTTITGPYEHSWNGSSAVPRVWPTNYLYEPHAPAGRNVHSNITDLIKFGASHLNASAGSTRILTDASITTLRTVHYPNATNLDNVVAPMTPAWIPTTRAVNGTNFQSYWHNGDNGFNHAWLEVIPSSGLSFAIATNLGGLNASGTAAYGPAIPAVNAMKSHCIDIHEHYNMLAITPRNITDAAVVTWSAGSIGTLSKINDQNFATQASFNSPGSAVKFTFTNSAIVNKIHLSNEDGKIRKYAVDKWVVGSPVSAWIPMKEVTSMTRDVAIAVPTTAATQYRLRVLEATSWPVKVDEFWLMPY